MAALGPLLSGLRVHLEPLGSLLGGHWRCWRAQSAFYEKVLLARAGCMEMVVLEGCWRLLGRCLVVLGGSWRLLGRSGVALGSCWLDLPVSVAICRRLVWQPVSYARGEGRNSRFCSPTPRAGKPCRTAGPGPTGPTWPEGLQGLANYTSARLVAPQGPADLGTKAQ